ncbi:complex I subunit 4 family protein [Sutcliffiella rhizosphaerae]|uniref:NAD(P)H-quinone oxidoreductase chain 4 1 n=1 Tax=Sutcliffiella rhizosphaerae TaxID=2880967 RepID=A0ABN8AAT1_9BACI|nr:NADH-quinone oxidoreductase subunit M [Sutcliffiella rhizosphaerae]CAG9620153.1 NAD(P)H-quinone oxidoreductase chain 4 1 [Sutcliffiella rhizosphaerae]
MNLFLTALIFAPLLGILVLLFIPKTDGYAIKLTGFLATLPSLILALIAFWQYKAGADLSQFAVKYEWFSFGNQGLMTRVYGEPVYQPISYELGIDGFSMVMILLTAVLSTLAAIASIHVKKEWKGYFILFLLLQIGMLGVFAAENLLLFFFFFELTLIPMFFLIGKWGYFEKENAAYRFLIYNGIGSAILLIVFIVLFAKTGTMNIAEITSMFQGTSDAMLLGEITDDLRLGLLIALLVAFGVKLPIVPLHTWMLKVHVQAPPSIVMLHAGVLLKIGAYGLIRFGVGIFPEQFEELAFILAILGVVNLLYGAFLALIQTDFKMVLAYSSISHMGIVLIGLASLNEAGIQGAIFQVVSHGFIAALLFFLIGVMYERVGTTDIGKLGGLAKVMPLAAGFFLVGAMASLGLPGMSGFVSEFLAFMGLFREMPIVAAVGTLGIILTAAYLLRAVLGMTFGEKSSRYDEKILDIRGVEFIPVFAMLFFIVLIGVYPSILAQPLQDTINAIILGIGG